MYQLMYFVFFTYTIVKCSLAYDVPALIWGDGIDQIKYEHPVLKTLSTEDLYKKYLQKITSYSQPTIGVFVERSLSTEDLKPSHYPFLSKVKNEPALYIRSVEDPKKALEFLKFDDYETQLYRKGNSIDEETKMSENDKNRVIIVELNDAKPGEDRTTMLMEHDKYIEEITKKMKEKYGNVVFVLTAQMPSWIQAESSVFHVRKPLAAEEPETSEEVDSPQLFGVKSLGLVYTKAAPVLLNASNSDDKKQKLIFEKSGLVTGDQSKGTLVVPFTIDGNRVKLTFHFTLTRGQWNLSDIAMYSAQNAPSTVNFSATSFIGSSKGFSFHTPEPVIFKSNNSPLQLKFTNIQAEYFYGEPKNGFSVADDTVYFFTVPILSGLFVTILLSTIVLFGLSMIFDIKTMDQFDDPKGKTVTINATE